MRIANVSIGEEDEGESTQLSTARAANGAPDKA
jgi:hypothetical protein